jgi:hypothetical protein
MFVNFTHVREGGAGTPCACDHCIESGTVQLDWVPPGTIHPILGGPSLCPTWRKIDEISDEYGDKLRVFEASADYGSFSFYQTIQHVSGEGCEFSLNCFSVGGTNFTCCSGTDEKICSAAVSPCWFEDPGLCEEGILDSYVVIGSAWIENNDCCRNTDTGDCQQRRGLEQCCECCDDEFNCSQFITPGVCSELP